MQDQLVGQNVLLVEDEFLVAMDLRMMLEDAGAAVTAVDTVTAGLDAAQGGPGFAAAVLDVRLSDGEIFPVADALTARGVPLVFHSGHARIEEMRSAYPHAATLPKPAPEAALLRAVTDILR
jgi:DNA-binding NtrC family response regulator